MVSYTMKSWLCHAFIFCYARKACQDLADVASRMGELEPWIDENFVRTVWYNMGEQVNVKMIRDKFSG